MKEYEDDVCNLSPEDYPLFFLVLDELFQIRNRVGGNID